MKRLQDLILYVSLLTTYLCNTEKVLMVTPISSVSHINVFAPIAYELGLRGHEVTIITPYKLDNVSSNVTEISVSLPKKTMNSFVKVFIGMTRNGLTFSYFNKWGILNAELCDIVFQSQVFQKLIEKGARFDSVLVDGVMNDCFMPVAYSLSSNVIILNTAFLFPWVSMSTNVPTPYSVVPNLFDYRPPDMNFWQRMGNAFSLETLRLGHKYFVYNELDIVVQKYFPNLKSVTDALMDVDLILTNGDPFLSAIRPEMPYVIDIGGHHLKPTKPLPKNLEEIVDAAGDAGIVLFSLGSIVDELFSEEQVSTILKAFSHMKYHFIWKYKGKVDNVPKNVNVVKWTPQPDLLGHPKTRAFITHAGLLSLQEACYHRVPTVTLPVFSDQTQNSAYLAYLNISIPLTWKTLTVDNIIAAVTRAAEDKNVRRNVNKVSAIFRDRAEPQLQRAVYWVEYVMKHNGLKHLKPTAGPLNFLQYFFLDAAFFIAIVLIVMPIFAYKIFVFTLHLSGIKNKCQ